MPLNEIMEDVSSCKLCKYALLLAWTRTRNLCLHNQLSHRPLTGEFSPECQRCQNASTCGSYIWKKLNYSQGESPKNPPQKKQNSKPGSISFHRVYWPLLAAEHKPHRPSSKETITLGHFVNMMHIILNDFLQVQRKYTPRSKTAKLSSFVKIVLVWPLPSIKELGF